MLLFDKHIFEELGSIYTKSEIRRIRIDILNHVTKSVYSHIDYHLFKKNLNRYERESANAIVGLLKKGMPIEYALNRAYFYDFSLFVDKNVLVPRPETEELVELILNDFSQIENVRVLDIGTGSGCIAIALAKYLKAAKVEALDVSLEAIDVARKNALEQKVKIEFLNQDILADWQTNRTWDVIASNPPYIPTSEKRLMDKSVLEHEPYLALFVDDKTPLVFYEKIANFALTHLNSCGTLYFEIHQDFGAATKSMLEMRGFKNVELIKDISSNDRMIRAKV